MKKQLTLRGKDMRNDAQLDQDELMKMVYENGVHHLRLDIGLTDDILIYNNIGITPQGYLEPYDYIIIKNVYASTWHNNVEIIFTDNHKAAECFENDVDFQLEHYE